MEAQDAQGFAVLLLIVLFMVGAAIYDNVRRRLRTRPCPRCGHRVPNGDLDCFRCDFDFRQIG